MSGRPLAGVMSDDSDLAEYLDDLAGLAWIPGVDQILAGIQTIATAAQAGALDEDATQALLTTIANPHGPDLTKALALVAQRLCDPQSNPALRTLSASTQKQLQHLGEQHAYMTAELLPGHANEAASLISSD